MKRLGIAAAFVVTGCSPAVTELPPSQPPVRAVKMVVRPAVPVAPAPPPARATQSSPVVVWQPSQRVVRRTVRSSVQTPTVDTPEQLNPAATIGGPATNVDSPAGPTNRGAADSEFQGLLEDMASDIRSASTNAQLERVSDACDIFIRGHDNLAAADYNYRMGFMQRAARARMDTGDFPGAPTLNQRINNSEWLISLALATPAQRRAQSAATQAQTRGFIDGDAQRAR